jgi:hypothetical protein
VATPLPHKTMFGAPHKGGPTGCLKKPLVPNPTLHPTQARLPQTTSSGEQHLSTLEATAQLYDHTYTVQQKALKSFKYDSSRTDALNTAKSSTRRAMYIRDNSQKRRVHGEITGRNTADLYSRSSSSLGLHAVDSLGGGRSSQLRSSSQMSSYLESTSADVTAAVSNTFIDHTLRKLNVTTSNVSDVLPELVSKPAASDNSKGPGWLRPTEHVPRASSSMW